MVDWVAWILLKVIFFTIYLSNNLLFFFYYLLSCIEKQLTYNFFYYLLNKVAQFLWLEQSMY
jgi:hypothetical protein